MNAAQKKKLLNITQKMQDLVHSLNDLVKEICETNQATQKKKYQKDIEKDVERPLSDNYDSLLIETLKREGREKAVEQLKQLKQKELSSLFVQLGGSSKDAKKPKSWLLKRILWELFDFESGHNILRND